MKKIVLVLSVAVALISCDKSSIQQTTDSIKTADSLFTKANDGLKTLDSISKTINDSNGIAKTVIIPEIEKQKKVIDSTIKSGGFRIDSINKEIEKITKNVKAGTEVAKTLDSANQSIKNGESALKVLTRTADRILKQTKTEDNTGNQDPNTVVIRPSSKNDPLIKTAKLEIQVEDLNSAKALLKQKIRENNADLVSENFTQNVGIQREFVSVKVPLQNFDRLVANLSGQLGEVKLKTTESEGKDYIDSQICEVEITLLQHENMADLAINDTQNEQNTNTFSAAFMKGFKVLGDGLLFLLPFWPIFVIGGLVWYFVHRNRKMREQKAFERQQILNQQTVQYPSQNQTSTAEIEEAKPKDDPETDYSKYLPKN
ncbi:DUF4349 domain-containing protein [Chryseobacterium sp.]|uniref:DUF4349 domain-containing protein n=1 Tax=Chryseobacterium sp. TaxID=1871047 RepID=UPI0011CCBDB9|nr:DUF4349 domain-containing protein [Chryseobacterium sp.]TXF77706.1 DUF4349 domain-containing protein [Chryseobacterium sp.]